MKHVKILLCISAVFLLITASAWAGAPPVPARIGGTVTVDGIQLTAATASGYTFMVTNKSGTPFTDAAGTKAEDTDGLNPSNNWYLITIPLYDKDSQPGGAQPGDGAVIHVYKNGTALTVSAPAAGGFSVGESGSSARIDLTAATGGQTGTTTTISGGTTTTPGNTTTTPGNTTTTPGNTTTTTISGGECPVDAPVNCEDQGFSGVCCPQAYPVCCGSGEGCCPSDFPYCGYDGNCYKYPPVTTSVPESLCPASMLLGNQSQANNLLRDFRDQVLANSSSGSELINLYYTHAEELTLILRSDPETRRAAASTLPVILPLIKSALSNAPLAINKNTISNIDRLCSLLSSQASPELAKAINDLQVKFKQGILFDELGIEYKR
ncbi:MAG: hypothetical protein NTV89_15580 [Proteobacteria bacterium]|nr:hypothetical protein [Pseudomonadota bacterium]